MHEPFSIFQEVPLNIGSYPDTAAKTYFYQCFSDLGWNLGWESWLFLPA